MLARRDLYAVTGALVFLSAVAWLYVIRGPDDGMAVGVLTRPESVDPMSAMDSGMADMASRMSLAVFMTTWVVMMVAMMFPATAPVVLVFDRWRRARHRTTFLTVGFVVGYLAVWTAAGLSVYAALMVIEDHVTSSESAVRVGGATLIAAGIYQLSPLKTVCLTKCRSPLTLIMDHAQQLGRGLLGPFRVGVIHGAYCLGCCWALMAVLVVLGLMNLGWMAAVSALILVEKVLPWGHGYGRIMGVGIAVAGATVLVTGSGLGA
jgi:predicted metal-binding membrane protein